MGGRPVALCTARAYLAQSPRGCTSVSRGCCWPRRALRLGCTEGELRLKAVFRPSGILIHPPVTVVFLLLLAFLLPPGEGLADGRKWVRGSSGEHSPWQQAEARGDSTPANSPTDPMAGLGTARHPAQTPRGPCRVFWKRKYQICYRTMP